MRKKDAEGLLDFVLRLGITPVADWMSGGKLITWIEGWGYIVRLQPVIGVNVELQCDTPEVRAFLESLAPHE